MGGSPVPFVSAGLSQHDSEPPTLVRGDGDGWSIELEFTEALQPGPYNLANWTWRVGGVTYECAEATRLSSPNRILLQGIDLVPEAGPDQISYNPPPFDVLDLAGNPLATILQAPLND